MNLKYCVVETREDLERCFDDLCDGVVRMMRKTGGHGQSSELTMRMILENVGKPNMFLLVGYDMDDKFAGFCHAMLMPANEPWVDIMGIYTVPGVASSVKDEVFEFLKEWCRRKGAVKIYAGVTRHYDTFFRFFHEPLGFKKIGIIVAYDLREDENATRGASESEHSVQRTNANATHIWTAESVHIRNRPVTNTGRDG